MTDLTSRERAILAGYTWWTVAWMLTDPDAGISHAKSGMQGGSGLLVEGERYWYATTARGIELGHEYADVSLVRKEPVDMVSWAAIRRHAAALPDELRQELADAFAAYHKAHYPSPTFTPPRDADKATIDAARDRFEAEEWIPWARRTGNAQRAVETVLARALEFDPTPALF